MPQPTDANVACTGFAPSPYPSSLIRLRDPPLPAGPERKPTEAAPDGDLACGSVPLPRLATFRSPLMHIRSGLSRVFAEKPRGGEHRLLSCRRNGANRHKYARMSGEGM